jgi:hypothetical protein
MDPQAHQSRPVRRVVLPGGRAIEVSYFTSRPAPQTRDLHRCPGCASDLVEPTAWQHAHDGEWELCLRCPNCEWTGRTTADQPTVERLDDELERGERALLQDLELLTHANLEEDFERFIAALRADHIWPMDF